MLGAQHRRQLRRRFHPVLQRYDERLRSNQRATGQRRLRHLPGLHTHQHYVHDSHLCRIAGRLHGPHHKVAPQAIHAQAVVPQRPQLLPTGDKQHLLASLGQPPAKVAPHSPCAKHCYAHENLLVEITRNRVFSEKPGFSEADGSRWLKPSADTKSVLKHTGSPAWRRPGRPMSSPPTNKCARRDLGGFRKTIFRLKNRSNQRTWSSTTPCKPPRSADPPRLAGA